MLIKDIVRVCHEVNRAYCQALGDESQEQWEMAPKWQQESAIAGVIFHITEGGGPEASHENWMKDKAADGWVYGPEKDAEKKTHPCMVPFKDLPSEQKAKDHIFRAIVKTLHTM